MVLYTELISPQVCPQVCSQSRTIIHSCNFWEVKAICDPSPTSLKKTGNVVQFLNYETVHELKIHCVLKVDIFGRRLSVDGCSVEINKLFSRISALFTQCTQSPTILSYVAGPALLTTASKRLQIEPDHLHSQSRYLLHWFPSLGHATPGLPRI